MAIKKTELYSSLWASADELRGGEPGGVPVRGGRRVKNMQGQAPKTLGTKHWTRPEDVPASPAFSVRHHLGIRCIVDPDGVPMEAEAVVELLNRHVNLAGNWRSLAGEGTC